MDTQSTLDPPPPTTENQWESGKLNLTPTKAENDGNGYLILYELRIRVIERGAIIDTNNLMSYLNTNANGNLDALTPKSKFFYVAKFSTSRDRDHFDDMKNALIGKVAVSFEAYPPRNNTQFIAPPKILHTRMRLMNAPLEYPLSIIEDTLIARIPAYIKKTAVFETYAVNRVVRNGHVSFDVAGRLPGIPFQYLRVGEYDVEIRNPKYPMLNLTPKVSSEDPDAEEEPEQIKNAFPTQVKSAPKVVLKPVAAPKAAATLQPLKLEEFISATSPSGPSTIQALETEQDAVMALDDDGFTQVSKKGKLRRQRSNSPAFDIKSSVGTTTKATEASSLSSTSFNANSNSNPQTKTKTLRTGSKVIPETSVRSRVGSQGKKGGVTKAREMPLQTQKIPDQGSITKLWKKGQWS